MSIYEDRLTSAERRALKKHTHDLADEIDLARTLINRELGETADIETICKAMQTISTLALARQRLTVKANDQLALAFQTALNALDAEENTA